jgi:hypothetical protein
MNILQAIHDAKLLRPWFKRLGDWTAWLAFLAALFALPMTPEQVEAYAKHTGRKDTPHTPFTEAWLIIGRRGGKSFIMALVAVFLATFRTYRQYLQPGERATVLVIAADRKQARVIFRYIRAILHGIPMLARMIEREATDSFDLDNSVTIEVGTASARSTRGYTYAAVLCDEIAFWPTDDAAEPDYAVLDAIRPGMATIPGAVLLCGSSPYARRGALWDAHRRFFGKDGAQVLVWQGATQEMNPTIPDKVIADAFQRDPASAAAEYGAQFRTDVESLLTREAIAANIDAGVMERPPERRHKYLAFVDPSGGSADSFTLAIAHAEDGVPVLDAVREVKPPFSPESVVGEFCVLVKSYGARSVTGDRYGGEWPREQFRKHGIEYDLAEKSRSELYLALVPTINSRGCRLLDLPKLEQQLVGLERRTSRVGKDSIDHAPGGHDDVANAVAGALSLVSKRAGSYPTGADFARAISGDSTPTRMGALRGMFYG